MACCTRLHYAVPCLVTSMLRFCHNVVLLHSTLGLDFKVRLIGWIWMWRQIKFQPIRRLQACMTVTGRSMNTADRTVRVAQRSTAGRNRMNLDNNIFYKVPQCCFTFWGNIAEYWLGSKTHAYIYIVHVSLNYDHVLPRLSTLYPTSCHIQDCMWYTFMSACRNTHQKMS